MFPQVTFQRPIDLFGHWKSHSAIMEGAEGIYAEQTLFLVFIF